MQDTHNTGCGGVSQDRGKNSWLWVALFLCIALPYIPSLHHAFVYDDHGAIVENAFLSNPSRVFYVLSGATVSDPNVIDGRRPVLILTYFFDKALWCLSPFGYHLTNLLLHIACTGLLFSFVLKLVPVPIKREVGACPHSILGTGTFLAFGAALAFGLHPVLSEAVRLPAFREDLLCTLFVLMYLRLNLSQNSSMWSWSNLALLAALLSKETAVIAPFLFFVLKFLYPNIRTPRSLSLFGLLMVVCFCFAWSLHPSLQALTGSWNGTSLRFPGNLFTAPWLWIKWLGLFIFPYHLLADYWIDPISGPFDVRFVLGIIGFFGCLAGGWSLHKKYPVMAVGLWWMPICFLPSSNIIPLFNPFADRYLYLATPGFALCLAFLLSRLPSRKMAALILAILCSLYAAQTIRRLRDWRDDFTLWNKTLMDNPQSVKAMVWVGLNRKHEGNAAAAEDYFKRADRRNKHDISGLINLAVLAGEQGDYNQAEELLREAIRRQPNHFQAHWNLAIALLEQGRQAEAQREILQTIRLNPYFTPPYEALAALLDTQGYTHEADRVLKKLFAIDPALNH